MAISDQDANAPDPLDGLGLLVVASLDPDEVGRLAVQGLVREFGAAFARLWLVGPGDLCDTCSMAPTCENRTRCLHLVASEGISDNLEGAYRRVPFSNLKIGEIASRRENHWTNAVLQDPRVAHKDWAREHGLRCFAGHALVVDGELLGVLATFGTERLTAETFRRLAVFSQLVAISIRNGRRFQAR
jgi:GAF domain-containing protein